VVYFGSNAVNGVTNGNVSAFSIDTNTGALTNIGNYAAGSESESIAVDSTGKFVYIANYATSSSGDGNVSAFKIDTTSGALTSIGTFAAGRMALFIATSKR